MIRLEVERDGEWVPVEGVTSVELNAEEPDPSPDPRAFFSPTAELLAVARRLADVARQIDAATKHVRGHRDRPAWQSPYGPPQRRHH